MVQVDRAHLSLLGTPPNLRRQELIAVDLSGLDLAGADFSESLLGEADLRKADLRNARFAGAVIDKVSLDGAHIDKADFSTADLLSIYATDVFDSGTLMIMKAEAARQWLFSHGALVSHSDNLNPFLGRSWYNATREVAPTLTKKIAGTHNDLGLVKGVDTHERSFAEDFVAYLISIGVLERVKTVGRGNAGKWVIAVASEHRAVITAFEKSGEIDRLLWPFFEKELKRRGLPLPTSRNSAGKESGDGVKRATGAKRAT
jgi:hypothetical protein